MKLSLKSEAIVNKYHEKTYLRYTQDALRKVCALMHPLSYFQDFFAFYTQYPNSSVPTIDKLGLQKIDVLNVFDTYAADITELKSRQWRWRRFFIWDAWATEKFQDKSIRYWPSTWIFALLYGLYIYILLTVSTIVWWQCIILAIIALPALLICFILFFGAVHSAIVLLQWLHIDRLIRRRTKEFEQTEVYSIFSAQQAEKATSPQPPLHTSHFLDIDPIPNPQPQPNEGMFTIHRFGPTLLTFHYPVNTDALQQIIQEDGLIGPHKYSADTIEHIKDCDNAWFLFDHPAQQAMLEKDLLQLVKHHFYGAYSFLGAITGLVSKQQKYWKLGAEKGVAECMVSYACTLYSSGFLADGFHWLKKGADAGDTIGRYLTAVSYQYGTLSEINLQKAASYYFQSLQSESNYFAYLNLGAMLMDAGCIRTALQYFRKAQEYIDQGKEMDRDEPKYCEDNITACQKLLQLPYTQRMKMFTQQTSSRKLDGIFCNNRLGYTKVSDLFDAPVEVWDPKSVGIEVDPLDIQDIESAPLSSPGRPVDKEEDYKLPVYHVTIDTPSIVGFPGEVVFLEKNCHAALNTYIREHLSSLRATFKQSGYSFTYLPSHHYDMEDQMDIVGSYNRAHAGDEPFWGIGYEHPNASEFWQHIQSDYPLPDDCAGILRNIPTGDGEDKDKHYEYILFPFRPGTDWARVFAMLADRLRHEPLPAATLPTSAYHSKLPEGAYLQIGSDYAITIHSQDGEQLAQIHLTPMPKVMFMALLNHPEGLVIKDMIDIREELLGYYRAISKGKGDEKNIDMLCDPTSNSANEKISRIRQAFANSLTTFYSDDLPLFQPQGKRGGAYVICWDRNRVKKV